MYHVHVQKESHICITGMYKIIMSSNPPDLPSNK